MKLLNFDNNSFSNIFVIILKFKSFVGHNVMVVYIKGKLAHDFDGDIFLRN